MAVAADSRPTTVGVSSGKASGPVVHDAASVVPGSVLVVSHLDPRLAAVIPQLAGLVAETGNALSHLAILAREFTVPAVVGVSGATTTFAAGSVVEVDGDLGSVELVTPPVTGDEPAGNDHTASTVPPRRGAAS